MNAIQLNRKNRDLRVKASIEVPEIALVLSAFPGFTELKTSFDDKMSLLATLQTRQSTILKGLTANIKLGRTTLLPMCLKLSTGLVALATQNGDPSLLEKATCTATGLKVLSYSKLVVAAQNLRDLGNDLSGDLVVYLIPATYYDGMQDVIDYLKASLLALLTARDQQKQVTLEIEQVLREIDEILARIALMVETLKTEQPVFYETFRAAYRLGEVPGYTLSASGYVLDAETQEAIIKCRLKITSFQPLEEPLTGGGTKGIVKKRATTTSGELTKTVKLTSPNGGFRYKNLPNGSYEATAYRAGFAEEKVTFYVNTGECSEVFIRLQKNVIAAA